MALNAFAFNDLAGQRENLAVAAWFTPLERDAEAAEIKEESPKKINLASAFADAHNEGIPAAVVMPGLPQTALNGDNIDALSVLAARGTGVDRKMKEAALLGTSLSSAFKDANAPAQQNQAPALSAAQQAFLNKLNSDPQFAQDFANNINKVTTALDQPKTAEINSFQTVRPDFDLAKHDETVQQNYCQAEDAKGGVEELKNMMEAHAEEMKAAEGPPDPNKPPAAVPTPVPGEYSMSKNEVQSPEEAVQVAAHGRGTGGVQGASEFAKDDAAPGYTGVSAMAAQPTTAQPAQDGRMFIHGPGLTDEGGKSRVSMTQDGKLEIDGMGLDQVENEVNTIHRESKLAAEVVDSIATRGVTTSVAEAADMLHNGALDRDQVNVNNNGTAQVFQLKRNGGGPGMG